MDNADQAMETLARLKQTGVRLAIDDFGTGYSSLSYLKRFPVDTLKIDRSFVNELDGADESAVIVGVTIRLAHALGMRVVAEGVETQDQLDRLRDLECDLAQGYHIARPLAAELMSEMIGQGLPEIAWSVHAFPRRVNSNVLACTITPRIFSLIVPSLKGRS